MFKQEMLIKDLVKVKNNKKPRNLKLIRDVALAKKFKLSKGKISSSTITSLNSFDNNFGEISNNKKHLNFFF